MAILANYVDFRTRFGSGGTDNDGYKRWNPALATFSLTLPTTLSAVFLFTVTTNAGANDAVFGVDEWDWYLSQRTTDPARQYFALTQPNNAKSGTAQIATTALGSAVWPVTSSDNVYRLVLDVYVYAKKIATGDIYYGDLTRSLFATY